MIDSIIEKNLKNIDIKFRFNLFFILNKKQHLLHRCYDSEQGFLNDFSGIKLIVTDHFGEKLSQNDEFELIYPFKTNYPFLYEGFDDASLYVKKIYSGSMSFSFVEIIIDAPFVAEDVKLVINDLIQNLQFYLDEAYTNTLKDMSRKFMCLNALQLIKSIRPRTFYHSFRVADLSVSIAEKLSLDDDMVKDLYYASLIHDVGEVWIPNDILDKKDKLTDEEMELVKSHPKNLKAIFMHNPFVESIIDIAVYHHERVDGKGYYGKRGKDIPVQSKILAVSEFVDGLHTDRPDRPGLDTNSIIHFLKKSRGTMFDEDIIDVSLDVVEKIYRSNELFRGVLSGKPVIILFYKKGDLYLLKGAVEYSTGKNLGVSLVDREGKKLSYKDRVRIQLPSITGIVDIEAEVISSTDDIVNMTILESKDIEGSSLEVNWSFNIIVIPLKTREDLIGTGEKFLRMKTLVFGTKSMLAKTKDVKLNVGDTVLIKAKPLDEVISIPAVVSDVIDDGGIYTVRFEYFGLNEAEDAKIHRAIYSKQISLASS